MMRAHLQHSIPLQGTQWASYIISRRVGFTSWTLTATGKINNDNKEDVVALDAAIGGVGDSEPADGNGQRLFLTWFRNTGAVESNTPWPSFEIVAELPSSRRPAAGLCLMDVDQDGTTDIVTVIGNQV